MRRIAACLLLAASAAFAQFQNLAASDAGDQLYFSSPFRQTGSDQFPHAKLFRWSDAGFDLVEQRDRQGPGPANNFYELIQPDVSGDGSVVTFVGYSPCYGGSSCIYHEYYQASLLGNDPAAATLGLGHTQLSRNGRYAVVYGSTGLDSGLIERVDLESGERVSPASGRITADRQAITSRGELLLNGFGDPGVCALWTPSGSIQLVPQFVVDRIAIVSDDGSRLVFQTPDGDGHSLWAAHADGTGARKLAPSRARDYAPAISNDGRWVVFESNDRVILADLVSDADRELIAPPDGVAATTISGMGNVVFVATHLNRLLRVDAASGAVEELVPRTPAVTVVYGAPVPGSLNWMRGSGLADHLSFATVPLPELLDGVGLLLGDRPAAIVAVAPEQIVYQIPFESPPVKTDVRLASPPSPFEGAPVQLDLQRQQFRFVRNGYEAWTPDLDIGEPVIVTQNFGALVTNDNLATEQQIVHLFATGGGLVNAPLTTGESTPAEPLPVVQPRVECFFFDEGGRRSLETLYVGLAPGLIGVYQITVRLPQGPQPFYSDPTRASLTVGCGESDFVDLVSVPMRLEP
jgi:uncharacterized protein (TIGR03437 family)